jgi:hypothetical protein
VRLARQLETLDPLAGYIEPTDQVFRHAEYVGGFLGGHSPGFIELAHS